MIAEIVITTILGAGLPASEVRVERAVNPPMHSIGFFDNLREDLRGKSITNAVLDRSIREESIRVTADQGVPELYTDPGAWSASRIKRARIQQAGVERGCQHRLALEGYASPAEECGSGFSNVKAN